MRLGGVLEVPSALTHWNTATPAKRASTTASGRSDLQGIGNAEIIDTVHARRAPMIPVSASLRL